MNHSSEAITKISDYITEAGGGLHKWYIGVTANPENRVFDFHNVPKTVGYYIIVPCVSELAARNTEKHFLNEGMDGGDGGGNNPTHVYAYLVTNDTKERD